MASGVQEDVAVRLKRAFHEMIAALELAKKPTHRVRAVLVVDGKPQQLNHKMELVLTAEEKL